MRAVPAQGVPARWAGAAAAERDADRPAGWLRGLVPLPRAAGARPGALGGWVTPLAAAALGGRQAGYFGKECATMDALVHNATAASDIVVEPAPPATGVCTKRFRQKQRCRACWQGLHRSAQRVTTAGRSREACAPAAPPDGGAARHRPDLGAARSWPTPARTAPARARRSSCSRACSRPTRARCASWGWTRCATACAMLARIGVVFGQRTELWWDHPVAASFEWKRVVWDIPRAALRAHARLGERGARAGRVLQQPDARAEPGPEDARRPGAGAAARAGAAVSRRADDRAGRAGKAPHPRLHQEISTASGA